MKTKTNNMRDVSEMKIFYEILLPDALIFTVILSLSFALLVSLFQSVA